MATSVNNIAATFATVPISSSSSSSSSNNQTNFTLSISPKPISTSWNPHTTLARSHKSSLLNLYGPPGPPPLQSISTVHRRRQIIKQHMRPISIITVGDKLPNVTLSYLKRNDTVQTVTLSNLCKGKRLVLVGASAAFSPSCARFVKRVESVKSKSADLIACVAVNDVFVMKAWGEHLAVGEKVMMLCDGRGELTRALGVSLDTNDRACLGLGVRSRRFCLSALNGVVTSLDFDEEEDDFISTKTKSTVIGKLSDSTWVSLLLVSS